MAAIGAPAVVTTPMAAASQLAPAITTVHRLGVDGTHRLTVDISPDELGPVRVTVALHRGEVSLLLAGSSEVSREALRQALPELRKLLDDAGLRTGSFDVRPDSDSRPGWTNTSGSTASDRGATGSQGWPGQPHATGGGRAGTDSGEAPPGRPRTTDRHLDIHI